MPDHAMICARRPFARARRPCFSFLFCTAVLLAPGSRAESAGQPDAIATEPGSGTVMAPADRADAGPADACFEALTSAAPLAERTCSDTIAALESLIAPNPADRTALMSAYNNRALARQRDGDLDGAAEDLERAMTLAPDRWTLYLNRGNLLLARGDPRAALEDFETARTLAGSALPEALMNAAFAHRALRDPITAERLLQAAAQEARTRDLSGR